MTDNKSQIPHPESKEHFKENIPTGEHKHKATSGKHPSIKHNLEKEPLHVEGSKPEANTVEKLRLMPQGENMHRWSGFLLMLIMISLILFIVLSLYFAGNNFMSNNTFYQQ